MADEIIATPSVPFVSQWQSADDIPFRREMIAQLLHFHPNLQLSKPAQLPNLAKRLELVLYRSAYSLEEYMDMVTLERRIQSVVMQLYGRLNLAQKGFKKVANRKRASCGKRQIETEPKYQPATFPRVSVSTKRHKRRKTEVKRVKNGSPMSVFLLNDQEDLIEHIYSFIDGVDAYSQLTVNRFTSMHLKKYVRYLRLSVQMFMGRSSLVLSKILREVPKLNSITLYSNSVGKKKLRALPCYSSEDFEGRKVGESLIFSMASSFAEGACKELECLNLNKVYSNGNFSSSREYSNDGTTALFNALRKNHHQKLRVLRLGTNLLGDRAVVNLSKLFESKALKNLEVLDVKENFIGERGAVALFPALVHCPKLRELNLRGNILTDRDGFRLASKLNEFPNMCSLNISENYIGSKGFLQIAKQLRIISKEKKMRVFVKQNQISDKMASEFFDYSPQSSSTVAHSRRRMFQRVNSI